MRNHLLIVLVAVWLLSCNTLQSQPTCDEIEARDLHELLNQAHSVEERRKRLAEIYDLLPEEINVSPDDKGFGGMRLSKDGVGIGVITLKGTPVVAALDFHKRPPTADKVIECLGPPQFYRAYYSRGFEYRLTFDLYFLDKGIMARASQVGYSNEPPRLTGMTPIESITLAPSVPPEEMLDHLNTFQGADFQELVRQQVKPWPGSWDKIEVDIEPSAR